MQDEFSDKKLLKGDEPSIFDKIKHWGSGSFNTSIKNLEDFKKIFDKKPPIPKKEIKPLPPTMFDAYKKSEFNLFPIGRPCQFNDTVDKYRRFGNYQRSKMSVIDLIPVDYDIDFHRLASVVTSSNHYKTEEDRNKDIATLYKIKYEKQIKIFQRICKHHGLPDKYAGLRLYSTDDTTANDTISINYGESFFQEKANQISEKGEKIKHLFKTLFGSQASEMTKKLNPLIEDTSVKLLKEVHDFGPAINDMIKSLTGVGTDLFLAGNRMTFPKIWQNSTYANNLSVNINLISPYGHPKAIKEFILKPLSYLIILAAPHTINGVTFGGNIPITIKAYGLNFTVLGSLSSIVFRRGGSNTSYNLYRQPLSIDISLEFQTLYDSFAVFDPGTPKEDINKQFDFEIFKKDELINPDNLGRFEYKTASSLHLMTSLGTILTSLKPIGLVDTLQDPQVYGLFEPPSRLDLTGFPPFTPVLGNLGSFLSGLIDNIGKYKDLLLNAPYLLQQGLANLIYNLVKGTVGDINKSASRYINDINGTGSKVLSIIKGNLF